LSLFSRAAVRLGDRSGFPFFEIDSDMNIDGGTSFAVSAISNEGLQDWHLMDHLYQLG
jgi:hypothetical protein